MGDDNVSNDGRRSRSGASTASHETSTAPDSGLDTETKYAPIRPHPPPVTQGLEHNQSTTPTGEQPFDHSGFASLHRYNNSQASTIDPLLGPSHSNRANLQPHNPPGHSNSFQATHRLPNDGQTTQPTRAPSRSLGSAGGPSAGTDGEKKERKAQGNNQANEKELRELIEKNYHRSLESIARDVRNAERTQKSEKAKQLFAMRWCVISGFA